MSKKKPKIKSLVNTKTFRYGVILMLWLFVTCILGIYGYESIFGTDYSIYTINDGTHFSTGFNGTIYFVVGLVIEMILLIILYMILRVYAIVTSQRFSR